MNGKPGKKKRHRTARFAWSLFLGLLVLAGPSALFAVPIEVTLYPESARIAEAIKARLQPADAGRLSTVFSLPGALDPSTLTIGCLPAGSCRVEDYRVKKVETPLGLKESEIEKKAAKARDEAARIRTAILAAETQIQFWQLQTKAKTKTLADARNMAAAIGQNIRKTGREKIALEEGLGKVEQRLRDIEAERAALPERRKAVWEVTATLSGTAAREQTLGIAYRMGGCGWNPVYRIEAKPGEQKIQLSFDAEIRQASGQDWKDVQVMLVFSDPTKGTAAAAAVAAVPSLKPDAPPVKKGKKARKSAAGAKVREPVPEKEPSPDPAAPATAPCATGACGPWILGKTDVPAGSAVTRNVLRETGDGSFLYRMESLAGEPILQAEGRPAWTVRMPAGPALFMIDGAVTGHGRFPEQGDRSLMFGRDPRVALLAGSGSGRIEVNNGRSESILLLWPDGGPAETTVAIPAGASVVLPPSPAPHGTREQAPLSSSSPSAPEERK